MNANQIVSQYDASTTLLEKLNRLYMHNLYNGADIEALRYIQGERQLSDETIRRFGIGQCPGSHLVEKFLTMNNLPVEEFIRLGTMVRTQMQSLWDKMHGRITFPVYDIFGRIVGWSGRKLMDPAIIDEPKYLNSPSSEIFQKSLCVFGLYQAREAITEWGYAVLVEGNVDVATLSQEGLVNVVAPCGTSLTPEQLYVIRYFSDHLVTCFDDDVAGRKATEKAQVLCAQMGIQYYPVKLTGGLDPDRFVRTYGLSALYDLISKSLQTTIR